MKLTGIILMLIATVLAYINNGGWTAPGLLAVGTMAFVVGIIREESSGGE